ncbi:GNAT family N-acetyltransferase [Acinetobacter seifertii]|uniref:GNAT family N-acetyltransferase n=1 Tax=Acinetobacter seifertii TaxID=1530123 RepID=UPI00168B0C09|nr:GNAT family N-acetyltransferase [Acinetobacter seifertii]QNX59653.1 GNAT family N-acetyltransferase [Acinetobacter seifertii]
MNNSETAIQAFKYVQLAYHQGLITFQPCKISSDLFVHFDTPNNSPRFTYVIFDPNDSEKIIAQCVIVFSHKISKDDCKWHIGWCVDENHRNKGYGFKVASEGLEEFLVNNRNINGDIIEAHVDEGNIASLKISEKLIGSEEEVFNPETGLKIHSFLKVIE